MPDSGQQLGRPRDGHIDRAVLAAARELLTEVGYARVTMDATAARAGVGKAAIYRRFGSKAELLFAAAVHDMGIEPPPDTGSLHGDLHALARLIHERLGNPLARQVTPALMAEMVRSPELAARLQQTFVAQQRADFVVLLERAAQRGELAGPHDPALAHLLLSGPVFMALFAFHDPVDDALLGAIASAVAAGLIAGTATP
ncbi:TetR/AcrR family transcriptional regulator [Streptomyces sp. WAC05374]|uniref:TetR/AcrR family transcriptional regulator n=1 Tax=Streptomyces sp. WAC05374 TaxID=2487420 RepID=UPI000F896221|nr:TetR/AcrR family transcriptional regulator [Streptomyces sp. WAC05374]RST15225.1 TetR/AcrR family transcriptional regulator [Streptomyces sp. WAC05374]TDF41100.1 TetR/AcrR family transcriptional regulator [Streptomyces sp. WAC05374]TDF49741.1 TetR/AcrR family transcriptional regulator [Streptomyces sp. WAC05374]TDF51370.1 TetR/AcrR family transcriptional regulator [Streptomyces sp. WAC05374]